MLICLLPGSKSILWRLPSWSPTYIPTMSLRHMCDPSYMHSSGRIFVQRQLRTSAAHTHTRTHAGRPQQDASRAQLKRKDRTTAKTPVARRRRQPTLTWPQKMLVAGDEPDCGRRPTWRSRERLSARDRPWRHAPRPAPRQVASNSWQLGECLNAGKHLSHNTRKAACPCQRELVTATAAHPLRHPHNVPRHDLPETARTGRSNDNNQRAP